MTSACFKLTVMGPVRAHEIDKTGFLHGSTDCGYWLILPGEAEEALDTIVAPFGLTGEGWIYLCSLGIKRADDIPWALIALDREYKLVGHLMTIKGNTRDLRFAWYSRANQPDSATKCVSFLIAMNKDILSSLANQTPLLTSAWELLKDKSENQQWFCISDPLPEEWARNAEDIDVQLINSLEQKGLEPRLVL